MTCRVHLAEVPRAGSAAREMPKFWNLGRAHHPGTATRTALIRPARVCAVVAGS